jgi:hypothetical protein
MVNLYRKKCLYIGRQSQSKWQRCIASLDDNANHAEQNLINNDGFRPLRQEMSKFGPYSVYKLVLSFFLLA